MPLREHRTIPVLWLHDPDDTRYYWERDWIRYLLGGLPVEHRGGVDTSSEPVSDALVIFGNDVALPEVRDYLRSYKRAKCRHGLIHLSDEYFKHDISFYDAAAVVFRTYYRPAAPRNTFALGYKQGFWDVHHGPGTAARTIDQRHQVWAFAGNTEKADRPAMLQAFRAITPYKVHHTSFWNSPDYLSTTEYRDLLLDAVFVPSPKGNFSLDCFRTYEALEAGGIPLVLRQTSTQPFNYYERLFGAMGFSEPIPFPQVDSWKEAAAFVSGTRSDPVCAEELRLKCHRWWTRYKEHTKACFTERVRAAFQLDDDR